MRPPKKETRIQGGSSIGEAVNLANALTAKAAQKGREARKGTIPELCAYFAIFAV
jgi:hypothetical protein